LLSYINALGQWHIGINAVKTTLRVYKMNETTFFKWFTMQSQLGTNDFF